MSAYKELTLGSQKHKRSGIFITCETCKTEFYVTPARVRQAHKNNSSIRFCSQKCYIKTGDNNPFYGGKHSQESIAKMAASPTRNRFKHGQDNPNFVRFGNDFFPSSGWNARIRLIHENLDSVKCEKCGYRETPEILHIHHRNRDRNNNSRQNLAILCPNCHYEEHFKSNDGWFKHSKKRQP